MGTTTLAVNSGVELAAQKKSTIMVDLKQGLGDVSLFLGVRSRYSMLDAIDGASRLDREFLTGLVAKHVSGLELLPGSDQFDRPASADGETIENVLQLLSSRVRVHRRRRRRADHRSLARGPVRGGDDRRRDQSRTCRRSATASG